MRSLLFAWGSKGIKVYRFQALRGSFEKVLSGLSRGSKRFLRPCLEFYMFDLGRLRLHAGVTAVAAVPYRRGLSFEGGYTVTQRLRGGNSHAQRLWARVSLAQEGQC